MSHLNRDPDFVVSALGGLRDGQSIVEGLNARNPLYRQADKTLFLPGVDHTPKNHLLTADLDLDLPGIGHRIKKQRLRHIFADVFVTAFRSGDFNAVDHRSHVLDGGRDPHRSLGRQKIVHASRDRYDALLDMDVNGVGRNGIVD
jgi:hypothetical protein